jgi:hypothetical protein
MKIADIARVAHEANRALCVTHGDGSQLGWDEAADWQRDSAIKGVLFARDNPDAAPQAQHDAWLTDKVEQGWVYGMVKDAAAKTHPCIVSYEQLPPEQRAKDHVFQGVVRALLPFATE